MSDKRYYIIGDIHGHISKLRNLINMLPESLAEDRIIFLGDYIDRGPASFEVIEYLIAFSKMYDTVFLMGNHEEMFMRYLTVGDNEINYFRNGGNYTVSNYMKNKGSLSLPESHMDFFNSLKPYYETDYFIAVHAGLNPQKEWPGGQDIDDLIWIREDFYLADKKWPKTVIFGHTPTPYIHRSESVYIDRERNIIGIDTCAMLEEYPLSCIRMPDGKIFQAYS